MYHCAWPQVLKKITDLKILKKLKFFSLHLKISQILFYYYLLYNASYSILLRNLFFFSSLANWNFETSVYLLLIYYHIIVLLGVL
jgi:hypothetical protein